MLKQANIDLNSMPEEDFDSPLGQPYHHGNSNIIKRRMDAIYREDAGKPIRKSHENPGIIAEYK